MDIYLGELVLDLVPALLEGLEVTIGKVLTESENEKTHQDMQRTGDKEGDAPGSEIGRAELATNELENERHEQLSGTTAHIPPPSGSAIGEPHDVGTKHGAHPELAGDEGGEREADEKPHSSEPRSGGNEGHGENGGSGEHDEKSAAVAGAQQITHGAHRQPRKDGPRNGRNSGVADVPLRQIQIVSNHRQQRRSRKRRHEADAEGHPREVEGPHVGIRERKQPVFGRLVFRIHRNPKFSRRHRHFSPKCGRNSVPRIIGLNVLMTGPPLICHLSYLSINQWKLLSLSLFDGGEPCS